MADKKDPMLGVNAYSRQLSAEEMQSDVHRNFVGGMWDEIGALQMDFMRAQGLQPGHKFADVGCGCLRGGIRFIDYLDAGHYFGLDINPSLLGAGEIEITKAGLQDKAANLLRDDAFQLGRFGQRFDFALSLSLFTHLPMNIIIRCLTEVGRTLVDDGVYFATYFEAPASVNLTKITHQPGGIVTSYDADPFHYSFQEMAHLAKSADLEVSRVQDWTHPRNQKMLAFRHSKK